MKNKFFVSLKLLWLLHLLHSTKILTTKLKSATQNGI